MSAKFRHTSRFHRNTFRPSYNSFWWAVFPFSFARTISQSVRQTDRQTDERPSASLSIAGVQLDVHVCIRTLELKFSFYTLKQFQNPKTPLSSGLFCLYVTITSWRAKTAQTTDVVCLTSDSQQRSAAAVVETAAAAGHCNSSSNVFWY